MDNCQLVKWHRQRCEPVRFRQDFDGLDIRPASISSLPVHTRQYQQPGSSGSGGVKKFHFASTVTVVSSAKPGFLEYCSRCGPCHRAGASETWEGWLSTDVFDLSGPTGAATPRSASCPGTRSCGLLSRLGLSSCPSPGHRAGLPRRPIPAGRHVRRATAAGSPKAPRRRHSAENASLCQNHCFPST